MIAIRPAAVPDDLAVVRALFREYADQLGVDLCFQDFEQELASLPGKYAPPAGRLLLAWQGAEPVGCVALRALDDGASEMKRLYVRDAARGTGLGRQLAERICDEARDAGYTVHPPRHAAGHGRGPRDLPQRSASERSPPTSSIRCRA